MSELKIGNCPKCGNKGIHACTGKIEKLENIFIYQGDINKPLFSNEPEEYKVSSVLLSLQAELDEANNRFKQLVGELENTRTQSQCELYDELYKAALGLSHGVDWNNGSHAIEHGYRDKLLSAVMKLKEQGQ